MQDTETRQHEMFLRLDQFHSVEHAADFPANTRAGQLAQTLHDIVTQLIEQVGAQTAARRLAQSSTEVKDDGRQRLRALLEQIRDTARGMDAERPGTAALFKLTSRTDEALIAAARAFLTNAQPLKAEFIKNELPADFLEQLQQRLTDFEQARAAQSTHMAQQVAATTAIRTLLAEGRRARQQLKPIVLNKYRNDPAKLAAWTSAGHVESAAKPKTKTKAATPPAHS
jgi:hypothetical protein